MDEVFFREKAAMLDLAKDFYWRAREPATEQELSQKLSHRDPQLVERHW
jgi:hypothetical protein